MSLLTYLRVSEKEISEHSIALLKSTSISSFGTYWCCLCCRWRTASNSLSLSYRQGTYLLLEKCKIVCYRNLFKRIQFVLGKPHIHLEHVARTLKWLHIPMDLDEIECILANLIHRGYIRGYISHMKRFLVLSKRDPFPVAAVMGGK